MSKTWICFALSALAAACASSSASSDPAADESQVVEEATLTLTSDFKENVSGHPKVGGTLRVDYALERLPDCRGNVGGGGPGWNIGGLYSVNNGPAQSFEVTELTPDGKDRVAKPAHLPLTQGGDLQVWFEVSSAFGCHAVDSHYGMNFHVAVEGPKPTSDDGPVIVFHADGTIGDPGPLHAGGKVKVRYEQDRLPDCRQTQGGQPQWAISGSASLNGAPAKAFGTGIPNGADRVPLDATVDLTASGELALWFEVANVTGCHAYDSNSGKNYRFTVE